MEGGDKDITTTNQQRPVGFSEQKEALGNVMARFPDRDWFQEWKSTLNMGNIKACVSHTYNKAMHIRN